VIPCDHRVEGIRDRGQASRSHVVYSDDHGRTWHVGGATQERMNECAVVELTDGRLLLNMRSFRGKARRGVATSADGGSTWSPVEDDPALVEPVCQASLIRYSWGGPGEKGRLLFSNPAHPKRREDLTVRLSEDDGRTWPVHKAIWKGSAIYSSLARLPDGAIGLLYEREDYRRIAFTRFTLAWLTEGGHRGEVTPP
jgi:sialidase-1